MPVKLLYSESLTKSYQNQYRKTSIIETYLPLIFGSLDEKRSFVPLQGKRQRAHNRRRPNLTEAEIKRACALFTTMVVLFTLINNNPQNDHHIKQTIHKDAQFPNGASVRHPEMVEARNSLWEHETSTIVLAQPQTRMEYTHFETSETFEPITGKRKTSLPTFHLVSPFAPSASSTADQQNGRKRRIIHADHGHGRQAERQHP
jgi:hypothetical protein